MTEPFRDILRVASLEKPYPSTKMCCDRLLSVATHQFLHEEIDETRYEWMLKAVKLIEIVLCKGDSRWKVDKDNPMEPYKK